MQAVRVIIPISTVGALHTSVGGVKLFTLITSILSCCTVPCTASIRAVSTSRTIHTITIIYLCIKTTVVVFVPVSASISARDAKTWVAIVNKTLINSVHTNCCKPHELSSWALTTPNIPINIFVLT